MWGGPGEGSALISTSREPPRPAHAQTAGPPHRGLLTRGASTGRAESRGEVKLPSDRTSTAEGTFRPSDPCGYALRLCHREIKMVFGFGR